MQKPSANRPRPIVTSADWDGTWNHIFRKYQNDLRHAYYIRALMRPGEKRLLEIAAGSFRDVASLNRWGIGCDGADFSSQSVELAQREFPPIASRLHRWDAFAMPVRDRAYDMTYHNGFWGLFSDDAIGQLAREQARVTGSRMIATVHNAHNTQFSDYFARMQQTDPLFNVRFFTVAEIQDAMGKVCRKVRVVPVGKGKKRYEDALIRWGLGHPAVLSACFAASGQRLLAESERLMCIGEL